MRTEDLHAIEQALDIRLPKTYRAVAEAGRLAQFPNADSKSVVAINRGFRAGDFGDRDWPHDIFAFADDGGGDHFCLDLSSPATPVLQRDHETLELVAQPDAFEEWLQQRE